MTQQEAKIAAKKGEKVKHRFFSSDEFVTVKDGTLIDENDYNLDWGEFWSLRSGENWQKDWEIYKPHNKPKI